MNKYSVLVRCVIYSVIGLFLAFPVQAIVFSYTDRDIQVLQLQTKKLELEIQLLKAKPLRLGAFESNVERVASSTVAAGQAGGTYFHGAVETRTATATLLTVVALHEAERLGLSINVLNATNSPGKIFVLPEVSSDNGGSWKALAGLHIPNGASGAFVTDLDLGNGSTTQLTYTPNSQGTTSVLTWFDTPVIGNNKTSLMRFRVWTTGTSSILLEAFKLLK